MSQNTGFHINFYFQSPVRLSGRRALKGFLRQRLEFQGKTAATINYIFCTDEELLKINRKFLDHDYYTDIITFELSEKWSLQLEADIYISVDRVRDNAKTLGEPFQRELHRVIFHGALHLCGYKDKKSAEQAKMREIEGRWLQLYFD